MPDHDNRDQSGRIGSLLSLVPASSDGTTADGRDPAQAWKSSATERHRRARSRREAAASPLVAALATAQAAAEKAPPAKREPEPFAEQERELKSLFSSGGRQGAAQHAPEPLPEPRPAKVVEREPEPDAMPPVAVQAAPQPRRPAEPVAEHRDAPVSASSDGDAYWRPLIDPAMVVRGVVRSGWIIAAATVCGAAIAAAIALTTPKQYRALTELIIDPRQLRIVQNELTDGGLSSEAMLAVVENQVRVLRSGVVLGKVVDTLGLDRDPEFNGTRDGGPFSFLSDLRSILSSTESSGDPSVRQRALAIEHLGEATNVERGGKTFVVAVTAHTESPDKSALIVNTLTDVFLETYGSIQAGAAGRASDEIAARLSELRNGVEDAERKVETFKSQNDIVDAQGRLITDDEIVKLNDQLSTARARTLELQARADSARTVTVDAALAGNLPEQMNSPVLTEMRTQYSLLRQEADRIGTRLGPRHPERVAIDAQVDAAHRRVEQELRLVASSIQVELRRAVQLEQELAARLAQLKARQAGLSGELVTLRELEREATAKRAVYEAFLLRAGETGQQKDLNTANVSVISKATPPLEPSGPSRMMLTLLGAFLGFGAGVGIGAVRGTVDSLRGDGATDPDDPAPRRLDDGEAAFRPPAGAPDGMATGASSGARDTYRTNNTAASAEEADMQNARAPMGWATYGNPMAPDGYPSPYDRPPHEAMQPQRAPEPHGNWMYPGEAAGGYAAYPQPPVWQQPQPYPQRQPYQPAHAPSQFQQPMPPQGRGGPTGSHMQPQGPAYDQYSGYPQGWQGQPPAPHYAPQPTDYRYAPRYPHAERQQAEWTHSQHAAMPPEPTYPYGYPQPQPMAPAWPQQGRPQPMAQPQPVPQAVSAGEGEKSAMEEIRDSLREFRVALRDLAESRGRRRFL